MKNVDPCITPSWERKNAVMKFAGIIQMFEVIFFLSGLCIGTGLTLLYLRLTKEAQQERDSHEDHYI
jgi:hypothetical protein